MKKKIFIALFTIVVLIITTIPVFATSSEEDFFAFEGRLESETNKVVGKRALPEQFNPMKIGTVFELNLHEVAANRFCYAIWQENNSFQYLFVDYYPSGYDSAIYLAFWNGSSRTNIGKFSLTGGESISNIRFFVNLKGFGEGVIPVIAPADFQITVQSESGEYIRGLDTLLISTDQQEELDSFVRDLKMKQDLHFSENAVYSFGTHFQSDYGFCDLDIYAKQDLVLNKYIFDCAILQNQLTSVQNQLNEERNYYQSELNQKEAEKEAVEEKLNVAETTLNNYLNLTDGGKNSILGGFVNSLGDTFIGAAVMLMDGITIFGISLGTLVRSVLFICLLGIIVLVVKKFV